MSSTVLPVKNNDVRGAMRAFLGRLLESGVVNALLVPKALPGGGAFVQSLVKDPAMLEDADPLAPTMAVQSARILSALTATPIEGRVGAVLKPCELRATVELAKFLQVKLDSVVTIGVDCLGAYEVKDFADMAEGDRAAATKAMVAGSNGADTKLRESCRICETPAPIGADITLGLLGTAPEGVAVIVGERVEKELAEKLSLDLADGEPAGRKAAVEALAAGRKAARGKALGEMRGRVGSMEKLLETFSTCVRCHNCMNVCPICYCKECVFKSATFEHKSDQLFKLAERKGALRMPTDTLMFHLTRLSHMGTSCVSCGMCDSACPSGLPVSSLFSLIGGDLQGMFEYVPGRSPAEEPPVSVFKEDELGAVVGGGH